MYLFPDRWPTNFRDPAVSVCPELGLQGTLCSLTFSDNYFYGQACDFGTCIFVCSHVCWSTCMCASAWMCALACGGVRSMLGIFLSLSSPYSLKPGFNQAQSLVMRQCVDLVLNVTNIPLVRCSACDQLKQWTPFTVVVFLSWSPALDGLWLAGATVWDLRKITPRGCLLGPGWEWEASDPST